MGLILAHVCKSLIRLDLCREDFCVNFEIDLQITLSSNTTVDNLTTRKFSKLLPTKITSRLERIEGDLGITVK